MQLEANYKNLNKDEFIESDENAKKEKLNEFVNLLKKRIESINLNDNSKLIVTTISNEKKDFNCKNKTIIDEIERELKKKIFDFNKLRSEEYYYALISYLKKNGYGYAALKVMECYESVKNEDYEEICKILTDACLIDKIENDFKFSIENDSCIKYSPEIGLNKELYIKNNNEFKIVKINSVNNIEKEFVTCRKKDDLINVYINIPPNRQINFKEIIIVRTNYGMVRFKFSIESENIIENGSNEFKIVKINSINNIEKEFVKCRKKDDLINVYINIPPNRQINFKEIIIIRTNYGTVRFKFSVESENIIENGSVNDLVESYINKEISKKIAKDKYEEISSSVNKKEYSNQADKITINTVNSILFSYKEKENINILCNLDDIYDLPKDEDKLVKKEKSNDLLLEENNKQDVINDSKENKEKISDKKETFFRNKLLRKKKKEVDEVNSDNKKETFFGKIKKYFSRKK